MHLIYEFHDAKLYHGDCLTRPEGQIDHIITDPPYSDRTHSGHNAIATPLIGNLEPRPISYEPWREEDVWAAATTWGSWALGWIVVMTDHVLMPYWMEAMESLGRYVFAPLPAVIWGGTPRFRGDGPASWTRWTVVSRPRTRHYSTWGSLPGAYRCSRERIPEKLKVIGSKPLALMRQIVRDYSNPGDVVCDPCMGSGTTIIAAKELGCKAIGIDVDEAHCAIAKARVEAHRQGNFGFTLDRGERR